MGVELVAKHAQLCFMGHTFGFDAALNLHLQKTIEFEAKVKTAPTQDQKVGVTNNTVEIS